MTEAEEEFEVGIEAEEGVKNLTLLLKLRRAFENGNWRQDRAAKSQKREQIAVLESPTKLLLSAPKSRSQTRRTYSKDGFHFQK